MNKLPEVVIVGRRNVGKSTLFNAIIKEKKSIVDSIPGLTRDVISYRFSYESVSFSISDTPGLDLPDDSALSASIIENAKFHLARASVIVFLLEYPSPEKYDLDLADILRKLPIPVIIVVNKMDGPERLEEMVNFYEMGFTDIVPVSATRFFNINLLLDKIIKLLPEKKTAIQQPDISISIAGRPNSGKSTLLNSFIGYGRSVVSDIPGTTRDSVDEIFNFYGKLIKVIDTAGIRKKSKMNEKIEYFSLVRALDSIKGSDVVIHLIDATAGITETDKKISDELIKAQKPVIIAVNKWDSLEKETDTFDKFKDKFIFKFYKAVDFPIISISAKEKIRIHKLLETALELKEKAARRVETPKLNAFLQSIQKAARIPGLGEKMKIYYATQTDTIPPKFKIFVNNDELFRKDVVRSIEKQIQKEYDMSGIPVIIDIIGKPKRTTKTKTKTKPKTKQW